MPILSWVVLRDEFFPPQKNPASVASAPLGPGIRHSPTRIHGVLRSRFGDIVQVTGKCVSLPTISKTPAISNRRRSWGSQAITLPCDPHPPLPALSSELL